MLSIKPNLSWLIITTWLILFTIDSRIFVIDVNYSDRGDWFEGVYRSKPIIPGTHITVELIFEKFAAGETIEQILEAHP